jgi:hypothetical protein
MREPDSVPMECPLLRGCAANHISQRPSKINHRHAATLFAAYFAWVMQDKSIPSFIVRICTTLLIPPFKHRHNMYFFYIFF